MRTDDGTTITLTLSGFSRSRRPGASAGAYPRSQPAISCPPKQANAERGSGPERGEHAIPSTGNEITHGTKKWAVIENEQEVNLSLRHARQRWPTNAHVSYFVKLTRFAAIARG